MLLLHTCCAPCSASVLEWLLTYDNHPVLFFFNPNIYPRKEYEIRKNELMRYAQSMKLTFIDGDYNHKLWLDTVKTLEDQPEKGSRCLECFKMRLLATAQLANEKNYLRIATTLASSRWKNIKQIAEAGEWAASHYSNVTFWDKNWRKNGLSERQRILLEKNRFYNQSYCGCEFSIHKNTLHYIF